MMITTFLPGANMVNDYTGTAADRSKLYNHMSVYQFWAATEKSSHTLDKNSMFLCHLNALIGYFLPVSFLFSYVNIYYIFINAVFS